MTYQQAAEALLGQPDWRFAKTMPQNPHEYTLRKNWENDDLFEQVVQFIRDKGQNLKFGKTNYRILLLNGKRYWTMGAPLSKTILINRADHVEPCDYDLIAPTYDKVFSGQQYINEEVDLFDRLDVKGRVLDIGCGTGMFLDHMVGFFTDYVGIDPSRAMLDIAANKHQFLSNVQFLNCKFEHFSLGQFDTILALFGSASYVDPTDLRRAREMLSVGGKAYLMFYSDNYHPITYEKTDVEVGHFEWVSYGFEGCGFSDFNNYKLITVSK